ncbi:VOC family protein [Streptomyces sp. NPDC017993]|uniref:VOC family protein n=1 Tax=Streptomyces sp. NPDC017993 TaxID=3365027 RepID=UPI00378BE141
MARPVHFSIHANDFARMRTFYESVFGWSFTKQELWWAISTGPGSPGIDGTMVDRQEPVTHTDSSCGVFLRMCVDHIDETALAVERHGGEITVPTIPVPGIGLYSVGKDPDGNYFQMFAEDPYPS